MPQALLDNPDFTIKNSDVKEKNNTASELKHAREWRGDFGIRGNVAIYLLPHLL
jgi:hypothetical protein